MRQPPRVDVQETARTIRSKSGRLIDRPARLVTAETRRVRTGREFVRPRDVNHLLGRVMRIIRREVPNPHIRTRIREAIQQELRGMSSPAALDDEAVAPAVDLA